MSVDSLRGFYMRIRDSVLADLGVPLRSSAARGHPSTVNLEQSGRGRLSAASHDLRRFWIMGVVLGDVAA